MAQEFDVSEILSKCEDEFFSERKTFILDCFLWEWTWEFKNKRIGEFQEFRFNRFHLRPPLELRFQKQSDKEMGIRLTLETEEQDDPDDDGFFIEFTASLFGFKGVLRRGILNFKDNNVWMNFDYDNLQEAQRENSHIVLKCNFTMHEITSLDNENHSRQEELIHVMIRNEEKQRLVDMAYLMQRHSMDGMFTGRQTYEFACLKAGIIKRTLPFAKILLDKKRYGTECPPDTPIDVILNYILKGDYGSISQFDTINLYLMGYYYDLQYLSFECRCLILKNLDYDSLVHAILHADMAQDLNFLDILLDTFIENRKEVMECNNWKILLKSSKIYIKNIIDIALRKVEDDLKFEELFLKWSTET